MFSQVIIVGVLCDKVLQEHGGWCCKSLCWEGNVRNWYRETRHANIPPGRLGTYDESARDAHGTRVSLDSHTHGHRHSYVLATEEARVTGAPLQEDSDASLWNQVACRIVRHPQGRLHLPLDTAWTLGIWMKWACFVVSYSGLSGCN